MEVATSFKPSLLRYHEIGVLLCFRLGNQTRCERERSGAEKFKVSWTLGDSARCYVSPAHRDCAGHPW